MNHTPRVLFMVTAAPSALHFLDGQLRYLSDHGWETHLATSPDPRLAAFTEDQNTVIHPIFMRRDPAPVSDFIALVKLIPLIFRIRPDAVVCGTPKAALLGLIASWICRVPRRIYLVHGLRFEGALGRGRSILIAFEQLTAAASTELVAVSSSVREGLLRANVGTRREISVLGGGSPNGVDTQRFVPPLEGDRHRARATLGLNLSEGGTVALFVGRLTHDKGLLELVDLANTLRTDQLLVVVGDPEPLEKNDVKLIASLRHHPQVALFSHSDHIENYYRAADVLVLPTKREGLPTVVIEAAATGIPTVSYSVTGVIDAVVDGQTGILVPAGHADAIVEATSRLLDEPERRSELGSKARARAVRQYARSTVWNNWLAYLNRG